MKLYYTLMKYILPIKLNEQVEKMKKIKKMTINI